MRQNAKEGPINTGSTQHFQICVLQHLRQNRISLYRLLIIKRLYHFDDQQRYEGPFGRRQQSSIHARHHTAL